MLDTRPDWKAMTRDEKLDALRPLIAAKLTSAKIAARFIGASRGSILGACHRAGLKMATNPGARMARKPKAASTIAGIAATRSGIANPLGAHMKRQSRERKAPTPVDDEIDVGIDVSHLLGLMDLERNSCRWPVTGTGSRTLFCGTHATHGPYCAEHAARAGLGYGRGPRP